MALSLFKKIQKSVGSPDKSEQNVWPHAIAAVVIIFVIAAFFPATAQITLSLLLWSAPVWLSILLIMSAWYMWGVYRRAVFISSEKYVLLEIKPPRSHSKTPLAMETVFSGIHLSPGESTWYARSILGRVRPWWSFEIASINGRVRFFVWTRAAFQRNIESNLYAQYPGVQVVEAPSDYTRLISGRPNECGIWGCDYTHTKPDPYPIKTYMDYNLDKPAKEYEQIDPLANIIEYLGTFGKGEQVWVQFIIRVHKGEKYHKKRPGGEKYTWKDEASKIVQEIRIKTVGKVRYRDVFTGEMRETEGFPNPTKFEAETMAAVEHNVSKLAFDVGIRSVYMAHPDRFRGASIPGIVGLFKQVSSEGFNGFKPIRWMIPFNDYPWEWYLKKRKARAARRVVDAFRRRAYFYEPYKTEPMIMSTEELATLYHIPSAAVQTPSMPRIESATTAAPANLPT